MSFGMTGVTWSWTFHSWPEFLGCTGMYCSESWSLRGGAQLHDLADAQANGTVQMSPDGAFQFARIMPE